jgi:single-strand DNA-binding protein
MASLNRVLLIGNLGQDPELRYTANQTAVATLNIATTDTRLGQDGQRQDITEWHRVVVWSKQAENCAKFLSKGRAVFVEGRLQTRSWEDKSGQKRYTTEIVAQNVQFLGGGAGQQRDGGGPRQAPTQQGASSQDRGQVGGGMAMADDFGGDVGLGGPETPGLDDIPF